IFKRFEESGIGKFWDGKSEILPIIQTALTESEAMAAKIPPIYEKEYAYDSFFPAFLEHIEGRAN
ncbi:MAG: hypothetical protein K2Q22_04355, partial [Cytophagales bacterium]|nr:hypothetical protein [Cytophagales bacterium]